jgi:hypothetical protein
MNELQLDSPKKMDVAVPLKLELGRNHEVVS